MGVLKNLREVFKGLTHTKLSKSATKFCPKCGSNKIKLSSSPNTYPRMYGITPSIYICGSCGYNGPIALEIEEDN